MIVIYRGVGALVVIVTLCSVVVTGVLVQVLFGDEHYWQTHRWPKLFAFLLAAHVVSRLAARQERLEKRVLIDKETGEEVVLLPKDSLFFIPLRYWPAILAVIGVLSATVKHE